MVIFYAVLPYMASGYDMGKHKSYEEKERVDFQGKAALTMLGFAIAKLISGYAIAKLIPKGSKALNIHVTMIISLVSTLFLIIVGAASKVLSLR